MTSSATLGDIPLFPLGTVLFPGGLLPLKIFEQRYLDMTKTCLRDNSPFGVCLIREGQEVGAPASFHVTGCLAEIEQWDMPHPNLFALIAKGGDRFRVVASQIERNGLILGQIERLPAAPSPAMVDPACREVLRQAIERAGRDHVPGPVQLDDPAWVSYRLAEILPVTAQDKQRLLEISDDLTRLEAIRDMMLAQGIIENINKNN